MTWFDQKICTVEEAQAQSEQRVPGFLQRGDRGKLWITEGGGASYRSLECYVVGAKVGFEGKFYYDVALPLGDSGYCAVLHEVYGYVTPPHLSQFEPDRYSPADITEELPQLRRDGLHVVRSVADHAAQAGVFGPNGDPGPTGTLVPFGTDSPTVVRLPLAGKYFSKPRVD